jgi:fucose permease
LPSISFLPFGTLGFLLFGALLVLVGASQDEIRAALDIDLARAGLLVSAVVAGIGIGVLGGGPLIDRLPRRPLFLIAAGITGAALLAIQPGQGYWSVFALLLIAGIGGGLYETILNAAALERYPDSSVRMVAILHSAASVGAMLTPIAIGWLVAPTQTGPTPTDPTQADWTRAFHITGVAHLGVAALAWLAPLGSPMLATSNPNRSGAARIVTAPILFLCLVIFAYVGVESAITGLAIPYAEDALALPADRGRNAISLFWLGLLAGRLAFAVRSGEVDDARFAAAMGGVAAVGLATGIAFSSTAVEALFAGVGFALGGVFPLLVALAGRRTPHAPATGVALAAGLGSAGGFVTPWLTGTIADATGIGFAMGTLALWCVAIALAAVMAERLRGG